MLISLDELTRRITPSSCVLFLGAGASIPAGGPTASELAEDLCGRLKTSVPHGVNLGEAAQVLELKVGRKRLMEAVVAALGSLRPDTSHEVVASHKWRAIFTTNFDTIIEQAYSRVTQPLSVVRSNFEYTSSHVESVVYYKIHGCVTQDEAFGHKSRMVLTTDDYDSAEAFRQNLFRQLAMLATDSDVVFIGYSLSDPDVAQILKRAIEENRRQGGAGRLFGVFYAVTPEEAQIWRNRGFTAIAQGDLPAFSLSISAVHDAATPSADIRDDPGLALDPAIAASVIRVRDAGGASNAKRLFSGASASYADIAAGLTFERDAEHLIASSEKSIYMVLGVAGTGKTTLVRRALFSLSKDANNECLELRLDSPGDVSKWLAVERSAASKGKRVFLFVDNVPTHLRWVNELIAGLPANGCFTIVGTAEPSQWVIRQKHRRFNDPAFCTSLDVAKLSRAEIRSLCGLVTGSSQLRPLVTSLVAVGDRAKLEKTLIRKCDRDFFVSLKALFSSDTLDHIVLSEFASIPEPARDVYRLVCGMQAAGGEPHRQLVLRVARQDAGDIASLLKVLDGLVEEAESGRRGIFVWAARHLVVARLISKYKYPTDRERYEFFLSIVDEINPAVFSEARFLRDICNSDFGVRSISDTGLRLSLYRRVVDLWPAERVARHRLIGDLLRIGELGEVEAELESAKRDVGLDPPLTRYSIRLLVKRAMLDGLEDGDRLALLGKARQDCDQAVRKFPDAKQVTFVSAEVAEAWFEVSGSRDLYKWAYDLHVNAADRLLDPEVATCATALLRECELVS